MFEYLSQKKQYNLKLILHSYRIWGEPRLEKPKELIGIRQAFSVDYIPKRCSCPVFIEGSNVWIKHRDYFSKIIANDGKPLVSSYKEIFGKDLKGRSKFIYADCWGAIVLRNEAWLKIENFAMDIGQIEFVQTILRQQEKLHDFEEYSLSTGCMERMWEKLYKRLTKEAGNGIRSRL